MRRVVLPLLVFMLFVSGCKRETPAEKSPPVVSVPTGQGLFLTHCVSCHQGPGNLPQPNAVILDSETLNAEKTFHDLVRHPRAQGMPPFSEDKLPPGEVHELYVYFKSLREPQK